MPLGLPLILLGVAILFSAALLEGVEGGDGAGVGRDKATTPSHAAIQRLKVYADKYLDKTGTSLHPDPNVSESVILGLAQNVDQFGRPLCPCNFYPDKRAELAAGREWICACDEMKQYKYCQCLLFVTPAGLPITEHLPQDHEARQIYGLVKDPAPNKGRESKHHTDV
ncbi:MAG: ferredoxin:thioredoxin reductase [Planctomycetia bacterium]|nr:ferredoxin:thioredoxin reductase [Planctomycetia bacterium]